MKFQIYTWLVGVVIAVAGLPPAAVNAATLTVSSGTYTVNSPETFDFITQTGGLITGTSTLTSLGEFTQTGGSIGGSVIVVSDGFTSEGGGIGGTVRSSGPQFLKGSTTGSARIIVTTLDGTGPITLTEGVLLLSNSDTVIRNAESLEVAGGRLGSFAPAPFGGIVDTGGNSIIVSGGVLGGGALQIATDETITVKGGLYLPASGATIANLNQSDGDVNANAFQGLTVDGAFTQTGGTTSGGDINAGTFTQSGDGTIAAGTVVTADSVQLQGGTIAGTLGGPGAVTVSGGTTRLTGGIDGTTALTVAGGRLDATGTGTIVTASGTVTVSGGTLEIDEGALEGSLVIEGGTVTGGDVAISSVTQSGGLIAAGTTITTRTRSTLSGGTIAGTLTADSLQSTVAFLSAGTTTLTGTLGGNFTVGENATFDIAAGGVSEGQGLFNGHLNLGTLNNAGTTTSGFLINEGVLRNSGTIDAVSVINRNSGTLQVDGTLTAGGVKSTTGMITGSGTIDADVELLRATIAPGNSPGTLTIDGNFFANTGSVMAFELGGLSQGDEYDWLNVNGIVSLNSGSLFDIDYFGGFEAKAGDTFDILTGDTFSFSDLSNFAFDFADVSTTGINWSASIFDVEGDRQTVRLTASSTVAPVPLPAGGLLLLGGLAGLAALRRRKRAA